MCENLSKKSWQKAKAENGRSEAEEPILVMEQHRTTRRTSRIQNAFGMLAVVLLIVTNFSHIHVRYCLDGEEAAVSIHLETENSHHGESLDEQEFADIESELSLDTLLSKMFDGSVLYVASNFYQTFSPARRHTVVLPQSDSVPSESPPFYLPPLRAPPAIA
jgi:hypothetical protein